MKHTGKYQNGNNNKMLQERKGTSTERIFCGYTGRSSLSVSTSAKARRLKIESPVTCTQHRAKRDDSKGTTHCTKKCTSRSSRIKTPYLPKDGVLLVKPIAAVKGDKELAPVRMRRASIGARH